MASRETAQERIQILAPAAGRAVPLEEVPDPVFSQKIIGDGIAVIPEDGRIVSPVTGEVVSVADTLHAYGFRTEEGLEILIHIGLETVALKGACFKALVKVGDKVQAGDPIAEVDLRFLEEKGISPITPILLCGGMEGKRLLYHEGACRAGESAVLTVLPAAQEPDGAAQEQHQAVKESDGAIQEPDGAAQDPDGAAQKPDEAAHEPDGAGERSGKKKPSVNFDLLQKLGKVLMTVIAVMPAAGLMISLGKLVQMSGSDVRMIFMAGSTMESIGWAIINNLHILFAVAIGGSWAKERAGGAFAAVIAFILINSITGAIFGVTADMLADPEAVTRTLFGKEIPVDGYFTSVLGAPA